MADAFLSGRGRGDLRPFLRYLDVSYRAWAEFTGAVRAGQGSGFITRLDPEAQRVFSAGVESATAGSAVALAESYEFGQHRRLLDLGGGTGSFLVRILSRHPAIECGLFELPHVAAMATENLKAQTSGSRVRFYEGDLLQDQLPTGYDVFLLANVVHVFTPELNRDLLERVHASAPTGARLLLADFWTNPTHTQPVFACPDGRGVAHGPRGRRRLQRGRDTGPADRRRLDDDRAAATDRPGKPCRGRAPITADHLHSPRRDGDPAR